MNRSLTVLEEALLAISRETSDSIDFRSMCRKIWEIIGRFMDTQNFFIATYDKTSGMIKFEFFVQGGVEEDHPTRPIKKGMTEYIIRLGSVFYGTKKDLENLRKQGETEQIGPEAEYWLGVPLKYHDEPFGACVIQSYDPDKAYTEENRMLYTFICQQIEGVLIRKKTEIALEQANKDLEKKVEIRTQELSEANSVLKQQILIRQESERLQNALYKISELSTEAEDMHAFFRKLYDIVNSLMYAENLYIATCDEAKSTLMIEFSVDRYDSAEPDHYPYENGISEYVIEMGESLFLTREDAQTFLSEKNLITRGTPFVEWVGVPLKYGRHCFGMIGVQSYDENILFDQRDRDVLNFISHQIATTMTRKKAEDLLKKSNELLERRVSERTAELQDSNLRLTSEIKERKDIQRLSDTLFEISERAGNAPDMESLYSAVNETIGTVIYTDFLFIALSDEHRRRLDYVFVRNPASTGFTRTVPFANGLCEQVIASGEPIHEIPTTHERAHGKDSAYWGPPAETDNPCSAWLGVPLKEGETTFGVICVRSFDEKLIFSSKDREFLVFISQQVANAIRKKQAEANLLQSERNLMNLLEELPTGVLFEDESGKIVTLNKTALAMLDIGRNDAPAGRGLREFFIPGEGADPHRFTLKKTDGSTIPILVNSIKIQYKLNLPYIGSEITVHTFIDISILEEAREAAERASREKSDFLANMSHEIRTPLNGVITAAEMLDDTEPSPEQHELITIIKNSGDLLAWIINDILDLSKIEANKLELENVPFGLRSVVEPALDQFIFRAQKKGLELMLFIDENAPDNLVGDPTRLKQILVNTAGNAVKFTEAGHILIELGVVSEDAGHVRLRFTVSDSGIGIAPDKLKEIFEPFTQADSSITRKYGGTGLGTTISKKLTELMGGNISVESPNPNAHLGGPGTVFIIDLPFEKDLGHTPVPEYALESFDGKEVLIVDDNEINRNVLEKIVEAWHFKAETLSSGPQALKRILDKADHNTFYDLLLLDYQMPEMTGLDLIEELRRKDLLRRSRIIILSSTDNFTLFQHKPIDAYLLKPIKQSRLLNTIESVFYRPLQAEHAESRDKLRMVMPDGKKPRLLLVEDNVINQKVTEKLLSRYGIAIDIAGDGAEAIEKVRDNVYDLIFMDKQMPLMNGLEATGEIRKLGIRTPIIAMTASVMKGDREECIDAGMDDYISKPIQKEQIFQKLTQYIKGIEMVTVHGDAQPPTTSREGSMEPEKPFVDDDEGLKRIGDLGALYELIDDWVVQTAAQLSELKGFMAAGNFAEAKATVHTIKGTALNLSLSRMAAVLTSLDERLKETGSCTDGEVARLTELAATEYKAFIAYWSEKRKRGS